MNSNPNKSFNSKHELEWLLTLINFKEKELALISNKLEFFSLETLGEDEAKEKNFSSIGEEDGFKYPWLMAKMTFLPSSLQWNHHHAITQFKGQKYPSTSKKGQYLKT